MIKKAFKKIISVMVVFMLAFAGSGSLFLTAHAAKEYSIKITYVGQPTETTGKWADYAYKFKFAIKGYSGTKLTLQLVNDDGIEVDRFTSSEIKSDDFTQTFFHNGKGTNGKVLPDGNYYVNFWIAGSQDDTEQSKYYYIDFKGNGSAKTTAKSYTCTYMGQPDNPESKYYSYAMCTKFKITGYKGKTFKIWLYDPYGDHVQTTSFKITADNYTYNMYYDGTDPDGYWSGDGKYKVTAWIDGADSSQTWSKEITLKRVATSIGP
ncbi:MAG: hypothetical protein LBM59_01215 [Ruminococcus sp.]|jgi:flagellar hook assembly protein FlgD|nr:hypothetical protein [Ruminococcus sp.]